MGSNLEIYAGFAINIVVTFWSRPMPRLIRGRLTGLLAYPKGACTPHGSKAKNSKISLFLANF